MKKRLYGLSALVVAAAGALYLTNTPQGGQIMSQTSVMLTGHVPDAQIAQARAALAAATSGKGFGPQSPRDLETLTGDNPTTFAFAPDASEMNLCNIHFHKNAEHRGGEFTTYAGNGDGQGFGTGYKYNGTLTSAELAGDPIGDPATTGLAPGDTIEVHFVHSTAPVAPGPTLGACLSDKTLNPHLRVETVVAVLVSDANAADFTELTQVAEVGGYHQAPNIRQDLGTPIAYLGSTTGPSFNTQGSPFQVSWSVRPQVLKVDIASVGTWLKDNIFDEKYAHGVRNLVINPALISPIEG